jgi:nicotinate-nucleotide pyrophosphorylase (carboxylating)
MRTGVRCELEEKDVIDPILIEELIGPFLREDIGFVDLTSTIMIDAATDGTFDVNAREDIVVAGLDVAGAVFRRCEPNCTYEARVKDGDHVKDGTTLARVSGKARGLLTAERTALNILQHLSGIATLTSKYVKEIGGTNATLIDTRKTTPGLRALEKHAVTCGGGRNHRLALDGGVLVKDNHIAVCGGLTAAIQRAKSQVPTLTKVQVECDNLDQVKEALEAGAESLLLDNMSPDTMREAVKIVQGRITLEASGGITLETVRAKAESGVDLISTGKITQSAPSVDIGLDDVEI